jgi:class 3 adenylate cyclase
VSGVPETQYATLGKDRIAYQVFGEGDLDLLWVPASGDCIDLRWDLPPYAQYLEWLGGKSRVISFDRRGVGASDAPTGDSLPLWEQWAEDARAVLDAIGSHGAVICGGADSGPATILFAGSHPARTRGLVLMNTAARFMAAPDYPAGLPEESLALMTRFVQDNWGSENMAQLATPDQLGNPDFLRWFAKGARLYMSPSEASRVMYYQQSLDVREMLPLIQAPTLVLHREEVQFIPVEQGRYLAENIAGAKLVILPGNGAFMFTDDAAKPHLDEFLASLVSVVEPDRALATILFTDIVSSTERLSALGDREWRNLLDTHDSLCRTLVDQHRGRVVKTTGDGVLATFDGPGRAIRCAIALRDALRPLGIEIRAGLHTGEVEVMQADIAGIGVHIAARVLEAAGPGELLVSPPVPMLVAGAGFEFGDRGEHVLKGVPGSWQLYAITG